MAEAYPLLNDHVYTRRRPHPSQDSHLAAAR